MFVLVSLVLVLFCLNRCVLRIFFSFLRVLEIVGCDIVMVFVVLVKLCWWVILRK